MAYLGSWKIDDVLYFYANTTRFDTGAATDADAEPSYRVYENETGTAILNGTLTLIDSANTAGFYSEAITLSAANGFEKGKQYVIYKGATVNSVVGATHDTFQIEAEVDANVVSDKTGYTASTVSDKTGYSLANGAITAAVVATGAIDADALAADAVTEIQSGLSTLTSAQVNSEVVDALATDTYAEPGQGAPAATASLAAKINYLYKNWRNKKTQTSDTFSLYGDDAATVDHKSTVSDDGSTATRGEMATGA